MSKVTPLMQQYWSLKREYPDTLLFMQVGDFFELLFEDAKKASAFLGIALTKRGKHEGEDIPLCGVPVHALDHYLAKLVKGGFCVAICEQLEQAVPGKMVKRGITRVLTPGTLTEGSLLNAAAPSYILSFVPHEDSWGLLFAELMTAQLYATSITAGSLKSLETELARFFPDEIILDAQKADAFQTLFKKQGYFTSVAASDQIGMAAWAQQQLHEAAYKQVQANKALEQALSTLYTYLKKNNEAALHAFNSLHFYEPDDYMVLDAASLRNLEIIKNNQDNSSVHTLFAALDNTKTAMGARTLKKWLVRPLVQKTIIEHRLDLVSYIKADIRVMDSLQKMLQSVGDLERVVGRIALGRARLEDYVHVCVALQTVQLFPHDKNEPHFLTSIKEQTHAFDPLQQLLARSLNDDRAKEWIIKEGFDERLDRLRLLVHTTHEALQRLEKQEQEATGINSLKIRYTAVHGYYIEITNANAALVPVHYKRQQTLVGRERYMCAALQELQHEIMTARNEIDQVEKDIFKAVQNQVRPFVGTLRKLAQSLAQLDVLCSFAQCAYERGYTRPQFNENRDCIIRQGKHPVVALSVGSQFIPNDTQLTDEQSLWIITGPNMGGKSTFLRQTALIAVMAQCGSFVPAQLANLAIFDAVFTRIGASDNVAEGKSTFLVEMEETAHICQYATAASLVILDEVGRGTSTFDGLALAQAVIEHIQHTIKARCLFATHYHELTALSEKVPGIVNYFVASKKKDDQIIFLHTMVPGVAQGSFGLAVAHLAHLPASVIARAYDVMYELSKTPLQAACAPQKQDFNQIVPARKDHQKTVELLQSIDYESLSPKKAFDILWQLKDSL